MAKISQLWIYPIKSLPGISLKQSKLLAKGLENDRKWMLVDSNNNFLSQRKLPQMALISVSLEEYGLRVTHKKMPPLIIPWVDTEIEALEPIKVKVWADNCDALHINSAIDNWFSEALEVDCQLVFLPEQSPRYVDKNFAKEQQQTRFTDGFPLLLISEASLEDLNSRLQKKLTMRSFRPNIVVSGCTAYAEDEWKVFSINQAQFLLVKPCSRCIVTTIDPETAQRSADREPLKTLEQYRKKDKKILFGQNILFKSRDSDVLAIGDELNFTST